MKTCKVFNIEHFGNVGAANLAGFVPAAGCKQLDDLEVGQSSHGKITKKLMPFAVAKESFRVTRLEDKPCV